MSDTTEIMVQGACLAVTVCAILIATTLSGIYDTLKDNHNENLNKTDVVINRLDRIDKGLDYVITNTHRSQRVLRQMRNFWKIPNDKNTPK